MLAYLVIVASDEAHIVGLRAQESFITASPDGLITSYAEFYQASSTPSPLLNALLVTSACTEVQGMG